MSLSFVSSMYLYLAEGSVIFVTNGVLLICILGKKKNRERREFLLIGVQAMADTCYAVAFMLIARLRLNLAATGKMNSTCPVWECALTPALPLHNWATPLLGLLPLTTSLNFFVCSLFPIWYLRQTEIYTACILTAPHLLSLLLSVLNTIFTWGDETPTPPMCVAAKGVMLALRIAANLASALLYAAILIYLRHVQQSSLQELTPQQRKTHRNATITLGCVTLKSILLLFIPDILLFFNPGNISQDYSTLLYSMTLSKTTINFFIYMWRYKELRHMVITMTCRRLPKLRKYFPEMKSRTSIAPVMSAQWEASRIGTTTRTAQRKRSSVAALDRRLVEQAPKRRNEVNRQKTIPEETRGKEEETEKKEKEEPKKLMTVTEDKNTGSLLELQTRRKEFTTQDSVDISRFWFNI